MDLAVREPERLWEFAPSAGRWIPLSCDSSRLYDTVD